MAKSRAEYMRAYRKRIKAAGPDPHEACDIEIARLRAEILVLEAKLRKFERVDW